MNVWRSVKGLTREILAYAELWKVLDQSTCALLWITLFSRVSLICHRGDKRATGASWPQFSKYTVIHGNQTQCFMRTSAPQRLAWNCQTFSSRGRGRGRLVKKKNLFPHPKYLSSPRKFVPFFLPHLNGSQGDRETIPAHCSRGLRFYEIVNFPPSPSEWHRVLTHPL